MLIYFWVVLVTSPRGFLKDLLGCSAICIISYSNHIVSVLKCMCSQNKAIHSFSYLICTVVGSIHDGNNLGTIELLVEHDTFLAERMNTQIKEENTWPKQYVMNSSK